MTALDHNHLVSRNCRDGYRCGPAPALLVSALLVALIIAFPGPAHSATFEPINQSLLQPQAEQSGPIWRSSTPGPMRPVGTRY